MKEKKKLILFIFLFFILFTFFYFVAADNPASNVWNAIINGPGNSTDYGYGVALDNNSNIYVVGLSRWSSATSEDMYLGKFNSSGSNLWNATINGPYDSSDYAYGIAVDNNSNIYIVGTLTWVSGGGQDIYLGKFNSSGSNLWNATINSPVNGTDVAHGVAVDPNNPNNIYVTGSSAWSDVTNDDIYIGKFNSSGSNLWNRTINNPQNGTDYGYGVALDNNSNIYVTGSSTWSAAFNNDIYLGKFNSSGDNLWNATINGPQNSTDNGYGIAVDPNNPNNIYVTGTSPWSSNLNYDLYLGKFNSSGSNLWNSTINGPQNGFDYGYGVTVDNNSNIYVVGASNWSSSVNYDIYFGKFNSSGSNLWNATIIGPQNGKNYGRGVAVESSLGSIYVVGASFWSSALSTDIYLGKFLVDTINPTATFTCTPLSVQVGGTITCSCSPADVFSGINSSLTSYTVNPDTFQTGTFTTTCNFADLVGNTGSSSVTYTVNQPTASSQSTSTTSVSSIPAGEPATVTITNPNIEVGSVTISTTENVSSVSVTVTEVSRARLADFEIGISTRVIYQAFNITTLGLNNSQIANASVGFRVNITWVEQQRRATEEDILLFRRNDTTRRWEALNTIYLYNDSQFYYYSAVTPGFSTFVIYFGRYECTPGINRCFENQIQMCLGNATWLTTEKCAYGCDGQGGCLGTPLKSRTFYIFLIAVVGVALVITIYFVFARIFGKRKHKK